MGFTDLPQELIHLVLSQKCISHDDIQPFLQCKRTSTAAYHRLFSGRTIQITCSEQHVSMDDHYDFGLYGATSCSDTGTLKCQLHHCLKPAKSKLAILKRASKVTLNMRFDEVSTPALIENLTLLASQLVFSTPKELHLHVTLTYKDKELSESVLNALQCLTAIAGCTSHLKLCLQADHLSYFAANLSELKLKTLNIKSNGSMPESKEQVSFDVSGLSKLKIMSNYAIPNLSFARGDESNLHALELHLPITVTSRWIQENQLRSLSSLKDLRIFTVNDCHSLQVLMSGSYTLPHLLNLYISFSESVHDIECFDFEKLAPSLTFLFLSDSRSTKTTNKVCKHTI
ncbi:hypothetical protein FT663_00280 [Candidozyma haemuli var. vulneris]|uniref:Uncharacterized protein n=1 Tax=Candidozyma haemuli TaxID=45357 RepID=A0A2V1APM6_9ASCO|nr:hypothetical protein CXQ85_003534 [[Candida] haemuloni]KAF3995684.1 hypothetical protein FT663_00280 [[Candida] haemuloni var. vulneris]PVH19682.1 hypothetical protein CXQ85_003534 [[Candida] haemuloni]